MRLLITKAVKSTGALRPASRFASALEGAHARDVGGGVAGERLVGWWLVIALLAGIVVGCARNGDRDTSSPTLSVPRPGNALENPGFESGKAPWKSLTTEVWEPRFDVSGATSHSGTSSAHLKMRTDAATPATRIWGVTQEVAPETFPEELSAFYRVDDWHRDTPMQYLQAVVVVFQAENVPNQFPNHQIRYILDGIDEPPFQIANAKYIFLGKDDPPEGEWLEFRRDVAEDFRHEWGEVPRGFSKVRLLFEVRFDGRTGEERPAADVYYDDMYFGSGG